MDFISFLVAYWPTLIQLTAEHLGIIVVAMALSLALGLVVGIAISFSPRAAAIVLGINGLLMTFPSLALFSLLVPVLGIGSAPAIAGLVVYTQLPLVRNVYTGLTGIDPALIEAAEGMGLTPLKILWKIKLPLAWPAILTGIRTATVMGIGIGAIAAYVGAGGLGVLIFQGISRNNDAMVIVGAILISAISILTDRLLARIGDRDRS
ncbi:MAG: ABC transporter permease [Ancalomicrobiaceae bacterium]|nr:ABC transporter permease [Ancalomicrobiaceae bacterium]